MLCLRAKVLVRVVPNTNRNRYLNLFLTTNSISVQRIVLIVNLYTILNYSLQNYRNTIITIGIV